jgi:autoinducer 2-degrading protein
VFVNIAIYRIHAEHVDAFRKRMLRHAETCLREEQNCLRFDVSQSQEDPSVFVMYEVFRAAQDFQTHIDSAHTKDFAKTRDDNGWLAERKLYKLDQIFPVGGI